MKAYKVIVGIKSSHLDYRTPIEEYYFNEDDARKRYEESAYYYKQTVIYERTKEGKFIPYTTRLAERYEESVAEARPNQKVVLESVKCYKFQLEEIEIN